MRPAIGQRFAQTPVAFVTAAVALMTCTRSQPPSSDLRPVVRSAMDVCHAFEQRGVAINCRLDGDRVQGNGWADAKDSALFDLPSVAGHRGEVAVFNRYEDYRKTVDAFAAAADIAGPHRYGAQKALVFTQINRGLPQADAEKVKEVLQGLAGDRVEIAPGKPSAPQTESQTQPSADAKWEALRAEFRTLDTQHLLARAKSALAVQPATGDSVREADMALAFISEKDESRSDVRRLKVLVDKKGREVIENDPAKRAEIERAVRQTLAHQMERNMVRDGTIESVSDDEKPSGAVLRLHGSRCSQALVNVMVANEAKFELRKAGWHRIVCHKSMFTWFDASL